MKYEVINEKSTNPIDIGDGYYIHKIGMDSNGNSSIWVSKGDSKAVKIQTNGNLPTVHKDRIELKKSKKYTGAMKKEIKDWYKKHVIEESKMEEGVDLKIANTIKEQLGGNKFVAMTGAKNFVAINNGLQFNIPRSNKVNMVRIILDEGTDTYTMKFFSVGGSPRFDVTLLDEVNEVYNNQLQHVFTNHTGLDTHL